MESRCRGAGGEARQGDREAPATRGAHLEALVLREGDARADGASQASGEAVAAVCRQGK